MKAIGLDIGTTSICAVTLCTETGEVLDTITADNCSFVSGAKPWERLQNPEKIFETAELLLNHMLQKHSNIAAIGLSGQMHGIVYVTKDGSATGSLYTWQDGRGDLEYKNGKSYAEYLTEVAEYPLATGFGAVTHYYNSLNGLIPDNAVSFCAISDLLAMRLTGRKSPLCHISNAASFGMFGIKASVFDTSAAKSAGLDCSFFPMLTVGAEIIGETKEDIPVSAAIGDNQASFIGAVAEPSSSILVNVGTGSQISMLSKGGESGSMEQRPLSGKDMILVGSPLCGGQAYAILEAFFRKIVTECGIRTDSLFPIMNRLTENFDFSAGGIPKINPLFCGTRENPSLRGSITNLDANNFTPEHFAAGMLLGIVNELHEKYLSVPENKRQKPGILIGSGNGIRKNPTMRKIFSGAFGAELRVPLHKEEAAFGAALYALTAAGYFDTIEAAQKMIKYMPL